jgi:histidyl-tRNA synthetase
LRPEGTAPVIRAFIENKLYTDSPPYKLFYIGPMFRYDRPQAGRYRQHHQFGVEAIGSDSPEQDAELIDLAYTLYQRLGLKNLKVKLNSIGDLSCRMAFREALLAYLRPLSSELSEDSQRRLEVNPLRVLDSKDPKDQEIAAKAPSILNFLNDECLQHFNQVKQLLENIHIPFEIDSHLVRGLDYYNKTVFEIVADKLGAQNSIGGGGRYDGLIKNLGGPDLPSTGFATGIERVIQAMLNDNVALPASDSPSLFIIPLGEKAQSKCFNLLHALHQSGVKAQMDYSGRKLGKLMQYADQIQAKFVVVIGDNEINSHTVELKEMASGQKIKVNLSDLVRLLAIEGKGRNSSTFKGLNYV